MHHSLTQTRPVRPLRGDPEEHEREAGQQHAGQNEHVDVEGGPALDGQVEGEVRVRLVCAARVVPDVVLRTRTQDHPLGTLDVLARVEIHE